MKVANVSCMYCYLALIKLNSYCTDTTVMGTCENECPQWSYLKIAINSVVQERERERENLFCCSLVGSMYFFLRSLFYCNLHRPIPCRFVAGVCSSTPCHNGGACLPLDNKSFMCNCRARFIGPVCEVDTDPCASSPCLNGGMSVC